MTARGSYVESLREKIGHDELILVGANVIVERADGAILLQRRRKGTWGLPGGQMELGETIEQTAAREVVEETSLVVRDLELLGVFSGPRYAFTLDSLDRLCAVTVLYRARAYDGEPRADGTEGVELAFVDPRRLPSATEEEYQDHVARYLSVLDEVREQREPSAPRAPRIEAIVFDMDGVLTDTEYLDHQIQVAFVRSLRAERGDATAVDGASLVGTSYRALYQELKALSGSDLSLEEIRERFDAFDARAREDVDYGALFRVDTVPLMRFARACNIRLAVASSASRGHIDEVLAACGIIDELDVIESGEGLRESKPNPEIYLKALKRLGVRAARAVAIEDSPPGIEAARAAGMRVIGYRETRMPVDQSRADALVEDMTGALAVIRTMI